MVKIGLGLISIMMVALALIGCNSSDSSGVSRKNWIRPKLGFMAK